ncbi:xylulokinase/erythritol kinase [Actinacidiphila yanglinensis]|uniref:Xylulokinase/erythritol kinase n=1 Tax=Actinacidiphila yanglinensis TaxID=310779 RepID=A0A1H6DZR1_9ACTN|nr:FGGY-family carbohydrate kinase [Actinacidiphila yanglinensis]SEG90830.1 xylulokinase/erythritol kinase [Actinacidiphila yanglinensis]
MFVGLDLGTSVVKAAAFADDGTTLRVESTPIALGGQGEHVEQDIEEVVRAATGVVEAVTGGQDSALVAITGQGDGLWLVDADGRAVRPALSWMDGRAGGLVAGWMADGTADRLYRRTGQVLFPGSPGPLLAWLDCNEPASLDAATTAGCCKDVVHLRLTGERGTDLSDASNPFLDPRTRGYAPEALAALGVDHRKGLLPPIAATLPYGEARDRVPGLTRGTPVTSGPYDLPASATGAGVTEPGDGLLIVGTTLACQVVVERVALDEDPVGFHLATARPDRHMRALPAMTGTVALDWVLGLTGTVHDQLSDLLDASPRGARGVAALPYLSPSGERAPFVDPTARAEFTGLDLRATRADVVRAMCEAIAFAARHCLEAAGLSGRLAVCGGGARNPEWLRLFADVLGRPLRVARGPEPGARGAVLAAVAAHGDTLGQHLDLAEWTAPEAVVDPDPAAVAFYDEAYQDYLFRVGSARDRWKGPAGSPAV